ncbi:hypothetical protein ASZ90_020221 [hydrocarbon metagenome]|uniref:Uncharacterized protein n=1 Tax=hydrocarbon metagenome TaxID=938273 RepID=A0A0W8E145_9ZZZZ
MRKSCIIIQYNQKFFIKIQYFNVYKKITCARQVLYGDVIGMGGLLNSIDW